MSHDGHQPDQAPLPARRALPRVAVLLSQRLANPRYGLDLAALQDWLQTTVPDVSVHVISSVARQSGDIARRIGASGAQRLVLAVAPGEYAGGEVQAQARQAGLDPLGIAVLSLFLQPAATERAKLLVAAAVAKTRAFPGSRPEHLKPSLSLTLGRRSLFSLTAHEYRTVPAVRSERCVADRGCHRCVDSCPQGALRLTDHRIGLNKTRCESCGLCLNACPADAITFPGYSAAELDAEIAALLDPTLTDLRPRGIVFVCRQSAPALEASSEQGARYPAGWLPVSVPCAGSLSPALWLRCLAAGAAGVGIAACRDQCGFRQGRAVAERVAFCQELLKQFGAPPDLVRFCPVTGPEGSAWALPDAAGYLPAGSVSGAASPGPRAASAALLHLAATYGAPRDLRLTHAQSPFGIIELDAQGCTACQACTATCPTGALAAGQEGDAITISFDPALCTACDLCVPRCPERERNVLRLHRTVDLPRLATGRTTIVRDRIPRCVVCGAPIATSAMMARVAELLGEQSADLMARVTRYCADCRAVAPPL